MLEEKSPQDIIAWALRTFGNRLVVACSFGGPSGMVLLDMVVKHDPSVPVYYLDTGLLFAQTYNHIERVSKHYGIKPLAVQPAQSVTEQAEQYGAALWERDPDLCCSLRKVEPQREFLRQYGAWMTGIRRDQSSTRAHLDVMSWDAKFQLVKINPLASWTEEMVWTYIRAHDVPYNPLHDRGYRSIGCINCTVPVKPDEDPRAGRWAGFAKTECGLHQ
jgi:phosphoadenosine phosphosulfate reductase